MQGTIYDGFVAATAERLQCRSSPHSRMVARDRAVVLAVVNIESDKRFEQEEVESGSASATAS